jgi:hypothetical protein
MKTTTHLLAAFAIAATGLANTSPAHAQTAADSTTSWVPQRFIIEAGENDRTPHTYTARLGVIWPFEWAWHPWGGLVNTYGEATIGHFHTVGDDFRNSRNVTQAGVTPVIRWYPTSQGVFGEAGIGTNVITPIYKSGYKEFSTRFQFGDHLGVGWRFDDAGRDEVALRFEHFSNASVKEPNPGENFVQLRYSRAFF